MRGIKGGKPKTLEEIVKPCKLTLAEIQEQYFDGKAPVCVPLELVIPVSDAPMRAHGGRCGATRACSQGVFWSLFALPCLLFLLCAHRWARQDEHQTRVTRDPDDPELQRVVANMRVNGYDQRQPIAALPLKDGTFAAVDGTHRVIAAHAAKRK